MYESMAEKTKTKSTNTYWKQRFSPPVTQSKQKTQLNIESLSEEYFLCFVNEEILEKRSAKH